MDAEPKELRSLIVALRKVHLPLVAAAARSRNDAEASWDVGHCFDLLARFETLCLTVPDAGRVGAEAAEPAPATADDGTVGEEPQIRSLEWRDEHNFWWNRLTALAASAAVKNARSAPTGEDAAAEDEDRQRAYQMCQAYHTLKLLGLIRKPVQVLASERRLLQPDLYIRSLVGCLKAVVLQPPNKCGLQQVNGGGNGGLAEMISRHSERVARWAVAACRPADLLLGAESSAKRPSEAVCEALELWEQLWTRSKLEAIDRLTELEFADVFRSTRHARDAIRQIQLLIQETQYLQDAIDQIDDYFHRTQLSEEVDDKLTQRIRSMETHLLLVDHRPKLEQFVRDHRAAQAATVCVIQSTIKRMTETKSSMESLKMLRRIQKTSGGSVMASYLMLVEDEQLNRMSLELRRIRQGFDLTDYLDLEGLLAGRVDMAHRLFERRLLFHRVKMALLSAFQKMTDWDRSATTVKIKDQYIELSRYLKSTEDKVHLQWFQQIQKRANNATCRPILRLSPNVHPSGTAQYVTTLHQVLTSIWDETRLFLEIRFPVPPLCHMLLMQKPELLNHNRSVTFILERLGSSLQQVAPFEMAVLSSEYSAVEQALNAATLHITWSSLCLGQFIEDLYERVERFYWTAQDVGGVSRIMESRIGAILEQSKMFLGSMEIGQRLLRPEALSNGGRQWIGQDFFQHLRRSSDHFLDQMHGLMMELPNVLLQVESLICNTQTGSAAELQDYYDYWRQRILVNLLESLRQQFEDLSHILEQGPSLFTIKVYLSETGVVVVDPDLELIRCSVDEVVRHWIGQSCRLPQWLQGTCIPVITDGDENESQSTRLLRQDSMLCECSERIREQTDALLQCLDDHIGAWNVCAELWMTDKASVCLQLQQSSPSLSQYDQQLQHYRNFWTARLAAMEDVVVVACVTLDLKQLKEASLLHADQWALETAKVWMATTQQKLQQLEHLLKEARRDDDTYIDIEILMVDIRESWWRLQTHDIKLNVFELRRLLLVSIVDQVPADVQQRLRQLHQTAQRLLPQIQ